MMKKDQECFLISYDTATASHSSPESFFTTGLTASGDFHVF